MARKVFISVLGAGLYEKCKYVSGDFCSSETNFIQSATLEYLQHQSEWSSDSKAYFLLTEKAKTDNWEVKDNQRFDSRKGKMIPYIGLKKTLEDASLPFSFEMISIPDGKNGDEMWQIFEKTFRLLEEGDELYFDLTHSFRYLPMLMLVLGNYAKFLKHATVCCITYGNYEARNLDNNEAPIVDLLPLSALQDWTFATADFLKNGYADRLVELSEKGLDPLMRNAETRTDDTKRLKSFVNNLKSFSLDMQTCRGLNIIEASTIKKTRYDINALQNVVIPQLEPVLNEVEKSIEPFKASNDVANALKAAQWCYDNQQYQQAITFLEEGVISYFCLRHGIALDNRRERELISSAFTILDQNIPKEKWKVSKVELKSKLDSITNDEQLNLLVKDFASVIAIRNDYNHCGMREGAQKSEKIIKKIKERIDAIISQFPISPNVPQKVSSCLINFSNHPSEYWGDKQMGAAKDYGEIKDLPFPAIDPEANNEDLQTIADQYVQKILAEAKNHKITVHVMGEMTVCFMVVSRLKEMGIECVASTTERHSEELADGRKIANFQFVRFRKY